MSEELPSASPRDRQGLPWSEKEERHLYDGFLSGQTIDAMAALHRRGEGGIRSRLRLLGLIDENGNAIDPPPAFEASKSRRAARQEVLASSGSWTFKAKLEDGSRVELKSNRPITKALVEQLVAVVERNAGDHGHGDT